MIFEYEILANFKEASFSHLLDINNKEIDRLRHETEEATKKFEKARSEHEIKLKSLHEFKNENRSKNEKLLEEINQMKPDYENLCKIHETTTKDFDQTKIKYIGMCCPLDKI